MVIVENGQKAVESKAVLSVEDGSALLDKTPFIAVKELDSLEIFEND